MPGEPNAFFMKNNGNTNNFSYQLPVKTLLMSTYIPPYVCGITVI